MWKLDYKESWALKSWCFWTVVLEKTLESPLDCREIIPNVWSILKEINPEYSREGLMLKLKLQYFGHLMRRVKSLEDVDAGRDWRQEEKGTTEEEMVGQHHRLHGHEFEQTPGDDEKWGDLACCSSRDCKESDTPERLNHNKVGRGQFCLVAISCLTLWPSRGL